MTGSRRVRRLNAQLQREISTLLRRQVADPRVKGVTVTRVAVTGDLSIARVFVRRLPGPDTLDEALEGLEAAGPYLRRALSAELSLRRVPEIEFREDHSLEQAMRIEKLLHEVRPEGGWQDDQEDEEEAGGDEPEADSDAESEDGPVG